VQGTFSLEDAIFLFADSIKETGEKKRSENEKQTIYPLRVMCRLEDPLEMKTALLYFLHKKGVITLAGLLRKGAPKESVRAIEILESSRSENTRDYALKVATDPLATAVKKADLLERLSEYKATQGASERDVEKAREILEYLCRVSDFDHEPLRGFVRDPQTRILCHIKALEDEITGNRNKKSDFDRKASPNEDEENEEDEQV
jgi:hypothetical protein